MVTFRILSNIEAHGLDFAIAHEAKLMRRRGYTARCALAYAVALVGQVKPA